MVQLAKKAVDLRPRSAAYRQTLGEAQYRAGKYAECFATLEEAMRSGAPAGRNRLFVAMAQWKTSEKARARQSYAEAVKWAEKHKPDDRTLQRLYQEAADLIGP
jgi:predicted Zn-dependent protease